MTTANPIPVGGFLLDAQVGGGGHGLVFRGSHAKSGLPVAVKVLPPTADRLALHGLKNEVQAVARLHHPHIVAILDTGEIDARAMAVAEARGRPLEPGSPWVALELASGGDLSQVVMPLPWGTITDVLRTLLAALAHAHARGVVHKDLKPANILLCAQADARPGLKLTDFGLAQWEKGASLDGGTPLYMAPEQFDRGGRDVGPWTDLYALGCIARTLACGQPPFVGATWRTLERAHKHEPPPRFAAAPGVPDGFVPFVDRLLEKEPSRRFRCAADADAALAALDPTRGPPPLDRLPEGLAEWVEDRSALRRDIEGAATQRRKTSDVVDAPTEALLPRAPTRKRAIVEGFTTQPPPSVGAAPPPTSWRAGAQAPLPDVRLVEAGLSLWGLRPVPFVGRTDERDALWSALLDVHASKQARLACVGGASGVGKSRLVEWMSHRAGELGAARILKASFAESPTRADGFPGMVARVVGVLGLTEGDSLFRATDWLARWLPGDELSAEEILGLAGIRDGVFPSGVERHGALIRLLSALARERPLLVWLDDVQWSGDALALLERVLDDAPELRALFVCTAVDELLAGDVAQRLRDLQHRTVTTPIALGPLDDFAHHKLCALLLGGASSDLVEDLRRRTEGNPMFAVHIVGDWVQRGVLEVAPDGLTLKPGASATLPVQLFRLWDQRIARSIDGLDPGSPYALTVAAVLGSAVDLVEWESATELSREKLDALVDALVASGLARRTETGFLFVHVLVRSSVERQAQSAGRLTRAHRAAAGALSLLWGTDTPIAAARIGRHLLAAGDVEAAEGLLVRAARTALEEGEILEAAATLADWEKARTALELPDDDARTALGMLLRARVADAEGRHDDARDLAHLLQRTGTDAHLIVQAALVEGRASLGAGLIDVGVACFERARALAERMADRGALGLALLGLGDAAYYSGAHDRAAERYRVANTHLQDAGRKHDVAQLLWSLGYVEFEARRFDAARVLFEEQRTLCRAIRDRLGEANAENALGELSRKQGDLAAAEQHYRVAIRLATRSGLSRRWVYRLNLAHTRFAAGDGVGAGQIAAELLASPLARADPIVAVACWWMVAREAARRGDLPAYDRAADEAIAAGGPFYEEDLAFVAQAAGDAVAPLDPARAERAWRFAREHLRVLGRTGPSSGPTS